MRVQNYLNALSEGLIYWSGVGKTKIFKNMVNIFDFLRMIKSSFLSNLMPRMVSGWWHW